MLLAVTVMPAAAATSDTTDVTGSVPFTIDVTAPDAISLGVMAEGENAGSSTNGAVVCNGTTWSVTAKDEKATNPGFMTSATDTLGAEMTICDTSGGTYVVAHTGITYSGQPTTLALYVKQTVALATDKVGNYTITITFTGSGS